MDRGIEGTSPHLGSFQTSSLCQATHAAGVKNFLTLSFNHLFAEEMELGIGYWDETRGYESFHNTTYPLPNTSLKSLNMKRLIFLLCWTLSLAFVACSQSAGKKGANSSNSKVHVGGRCEGCEAIYESPIPFEKLSTTDTLPDFNEPGPKILISGIVYEMEKHRQRMW